MKIAMTGASGLIGTALTEFFVGEGHEVIPLKQEGDWNIEGVDVLINLAGENISGRWTADKMKKIRDSRVKGTKKLAEAILRTAHPPKIWINASAIGYYGDRPEGDITEASSPGKGFLADVVKEWEEATEPALKRGVRIVMMRTGIVLSKKGGALSRMLLPFRLGLGGVIGSGKQWMSWIDLDDVVGAVDHLIKGESIFGPVNLTAPHPVTNREFTKTLGKVLHRYTPFPMPEFLVKFLFGKMGEELLLQGARVIPEKLKATGYEFRFPFLEESLKEGLCRYP